jgi:hypothetical protein
MFTKTKMFIKKSAVILSCLFASSCLLLVVVYGVAKASLDMADRWFPAYVSADVFVPRKSVKPLTVEDKIRKVAKEKNFKFADYLVNLAFCESRLDPLAIGDKGLARGLFQIRKDYHPEVSTLMAFNVEQSTAWTIDMINAGKQGQWSCNAIVLARK